MGNSSLVLKRIYTAISNIITEQPNVKEKLADRLREISIKCFPDTDTQLMPPFEATIKYSVSLGMFEYSARFYAGINACLSSEQLVSILQRVLESSDEFQSDVLCKETNQIPTGFNRNLFKSNPLEIAGGAKEPPPSRCVSQGSFGSVDTQMFQNLQSK